MRISTKARLASTLSLGIAAFALAWLMFMLLAGQPTIAHDLCDYDPITGELVCDEHSHTTPTPTPTPTATAEPTQVNCTDVIKPTENCLPSPAPSNLAVGTVTQTSVGLSWDSVSGAAEYRVEYKRSTAGSWTNDGTTTSTSYTVSGLDPDTAYQFRVRSRGDGSESTTSWQGTSPTSPVNARTEDDDPINCSDVIKPTENCLPSPAPDNLAVGTVTSTSVRLSWDSVSGAAEYRVENKESTASSWTNDGTTTSTSYTVSGLDPDTAYQFRVRSQGDGSESTTSYEGTTPTSPVNARTEEDDPDPINCSDVIKPTENCLPSPAPDNLAVGTVTSTSVRLSWDSVSGAAEYRVEYKESTASSWTNDGTTTSTSYTVAGLDPDTAYQFRVRSRGDGSESTTSYEGTTPTSPVNARTEEDDPDPISCVDVIKPTVNCLPSPAPANLTVGTITRVSVSLSWRSVSGAAEYRVEYAESGSDSWTNDGTTTGTNYTVSNLECNTGYQFRVRSRGDGSESTTGWEGTTPTSPETATTALCIPTAPTGFTATVRGGSWISFAWDSLTGAEEYEIYSKTADSRDWNENPDSTETGTSVRLRLYPCDMTSHRVDYDFRIRAYGDGTTLAEEWGAYGYDSVDMACPPPVVYTAAAADQESIDLTWGSISGVTRFRVFHRSSGGTFVLDSDQIPASSTGYTVDNLHCGTEYRFSVSALGDGTTYAPRWSATKSQYHQNGDTDDCEVSFAESSYIVAEGDSVNVTVEMRPAPGRQLIIPLRTTHLGGATSADYSGVPDDLTFGASDMEESFSFSATQDTIVDPGERVRLSFGPLPDG